MAGENKVKGPVYNVNVSGETRRAIDLEALNRHIESMKLRLSSLEVDPNKVDPEEKTTEYLFKMYASAFKDIDVVVKKGLGLIKEEGEQNNEEEKEGEEEKNQEPQKEEKESEEEVKYDESQESNEKVNL